MKDSDCVNFLQWALPKLHLRWKGFRKVRKRVCRRIQKRMDELQTENIEGYIEYIEKNEEEWEFLDSCCRITISRFYRDRGLFDTLSREIFPILVNMAIEKGWNEIKVWSAGCASGEEAYTVKIIWENLVQESCTGLHLDIVATDINRKVLSRARVGNYSKSSFWELPEKLFKAYFYREGEFYRVMQWIKDGINFIGQDIRKEMPREDFHVILCRNLVFTYFDEQLQRSILNDMEKHIIPGGFLITGCHEELPQGNFQLKKLGKYKMIYRKN